MNAALVKIDVAAATLGWSAAKLFDLVDGGTLLEKSFVWVFNLANDPKGERRNLRFWLPEIQARNSSKPGRYGYWELEHVLARILPEKRVNFHAGEIDQLFQIRPSMRIEMHAELSGSLEGGRNFYQRAALSEFLKRRWLGALYERAKLSPRAAASPSADTNKQTTHAATSLP